MKLNLGSGPNLKPGFLNIDILPIKHKDYIQFDLIKGVPNIPDVDFIYSCHFLEHFSWIDGQKILKSCYNLLKPKGEVRLVLPDFRKMVSAYVNNDWNFWLPEVRHFAPNNQMMEIMNYGLYQRDNEGVAEHKCMYDSEFAIFSLRKAGFINCKEEFNLRDCDETAELRTRYSMYLIGEK